MCVVIAFFFLQQNFEVNFYCQLRQITLSPVNFWYDNVFAIDCSTTTTVSVDEEVASLYKVFIRNDILREQQKKPRLVKKQKVVVSRVYIRMG